ncbi:MAG: hypothetical protein Q8T08_19455, partial [Ignavibacteria bacterium]|nr:hypothetical protein [Ignavibacteria bacterium]
MRRNFVFYMLLLVSLGACQQNNRSADTHNHAPIKKQYTAYTTEYEVFAEADLFIIGEQSTILAHFSLIPDLRALEEGRITLRLQVAGTEVSQMLASPTKKGIYSFDLKPVASGIGQLVFDIQSEKGNSQVIVPKVKVWADEHDASHQETEDEAPANAIFFSKEQSWKIDFATAFPFNTAFGQVITTTAKVSSAPQDEIILSAKA